MQYSGPMDITISQGTPSVANPMWAPLGAPSISNPVWDLRATPSIEDLKWRFSGELPDDKAELTVRGLEIVLYPMEVPRIGEIIPNLQRTISGKTGCLGSADRKWYRVLSDDIKRRASFNVPIYEKLEGRNGRQLTDFDILFGSYVIEVKYTAELLAQDKWTTDQLMKQVEMQHQIASDYGLEYHYVVVYSPSFSPPPSEYISMIGIDRKDIKEASSRSFFRTLKSMGIKVHEVDLHSFSRAIEDIIDEI